MLRKPRTVITKENYSVIQLLDLLKDLGRYVDDDMSVAAERIGAYIKENGIRRAEVDEYITLFPDRVYKYIYETRLYNAFA